MALDRGELRAELARLVGRYHAARKAAESDPTAGSTIRALQAWQARRLAATYADLRASDRYCAAVDFFLTDLYGPQDLSHRDTQMLRALGKLERFLPAGALGALTHAFELHVLTIELDAATARALPRDGKVDDDSYAEAYRRAGRVDEREHQIDLVAEIGQLLDGVARHREVGLALRLAHGPAHAAGYGALQDFLERGYGAFKRMRGASEFLSTIDTRERDIMRRVLASDPDPFRR